MTYATEAERVEAKRASRRRAYERSKTGTPLEARAKQHQIHDCPKTHFYPETRAPRVDRSTMTDEEWAAFNKKQQAERSARYNKRYPGRTNAKLRKRRAEYPWYSSLLHAGDRSRKNGLEHNLTVEWAEKTYTGVCSLTGIPFIISAQEKAGKSGGRPYSPSIDRINPLKGYTQDNCRWVLFAVNSFKQQMTDAEMLAIANALTKR